MQKRITGEDHIKASTFAVAAVAVGLFAAPAFAATPDQSNPSNSGQTSSQDMTSVGQTLKQDLQKAGFTNIDIAPEAFVVRAKNSSGQPVMMRIGPDSMTEITAIPNQNGSSGTAGHPGTGSSSSAK